MRRLTLAAILGLGLLGGTATVTTGQAAVPGGTSIMGTELIVPVQYRPDYRRPHYAPPPRRYYRRHYAPPPRPYYRQRYVRPYHPYAPPWSYRRRY